MKSGIYKLNFIGTQKCYIGQSTNIEKRFREHTSDILNNTCSKKVLQAYLDYGMPTLEIIFEATYNLDSHENYFISLYNSVIYGFNTLTLAGSYPTNIGLNNSASIYSEEAIEKVFFLLLDVKNTASNIEKVTGVPKGTISRISSGIGHLWLKDKYPIEYTKLLSLIGNRTKKSILIKEYPLIKSPDGTIYKIDILSDFVKQHNLNSSPLGKVLKGERKSHKNWILA